MARVLKGGYNGEGLHIAIVVSRFNSQVTEKLLGGALDGLSSNRVNDEDITVAWVPGSFEIPVVAQTLADSGEFNAIICLGAVVRHETDHYIHVATQTAEGIAAVSIETGVPTIFGVLTTDTELQAIERAGGKEGNRGYDASLAAIETANLMQEIESLNK
ncbi:MAG: 6,7-dimethyl-8-ribityllumazine synthase [Chloroflexi bacterium]|jgi:6,7-dimethyl-8-ribityllumazine synthase|nr:MAG: 6,7-dimethyl-8-ribityllumazine synthase [Chloroflexota bacterium]